MEKKRKKLFITGTILILTLGLLCAGAIGYLWFAPQFFPPKTAYVYIYPDDTLDSIYNKVEKAGCPRTFIGFRWMAQYRHYDQHIHTGRYAIRQGENVYHVLSRLLWGYQEPMNLVVGSVRNLDRLARHVGQQLMADSTDIAKVLSDSTLIASAGYTPQTLPALFIPNTYEVYWDMSAHAFLDRMVQEHDRFWTKARRDKAQALGMTPIEVATLASIVEEETNNREEKPIVAGLYINRLQRGMPLQADPTVRFAVGEFGRQRITYADLAWDSPYNTYLHAGLPPGPIRIPTPEGLDAVLDYTRHNYLYMCAKEDFSGRHNFASNYADHLRNARRYQQALNERRIFR